MVPCSVARDAEVFGEEELEDEGYLVGEEEEGCVCRVEEDLRMLGGKGFVSGGWGMDWEDVQVVMLKGSW